jgi:hypothetical protein
MTKEFIIRRMNRSDVDFAIELAANEGWNPGLNDADLFFNTDPKGFLIGMYGDKPIACISVVSYENKFGFLGFYIVVPEFRGQGYGLQIWNAGIKKLKKQNIALDGVLAQKENYMKSGFKFAYSNIRYEWKNKTRKFDNKSILNLSDVSLEEVYEYDKKFFPVDRSTFLNGWLNMPDSFTSIHKQENKVDGYGVIRKCRVGYKIGPLFADDADVAKNIYLSLAAKVEKAEPIFLDVPEVNEKGMELAAKLKMKNVFGTARMYTGEIPEISIDRTYGVTSFELG